MGNDVEQVATFDFRVVAASAGLAEGISTKWLVKADRRPLEQLAHSGCSDLRARGGGVASGVWCSARLVEIGRSKDKHTRNGKARAVDLSGRRYCREHTCIRIRKRTGDQRVREAACWHPGCKVKLDKPRGASLSACEQPWCRSDSVQIDGQKQV